MGLDKILLLQKVGAIWYLFGVYHRVSTNIRRKNKKIWPQLSCRIEEFTRLFCVGIEYYIFFAWWFQSWEWNRLGGLFERWWNFVVAGLEPWPRPGPFNFISLCLSSCNNTRAHRGHGITVRLYRLSHTTQQITFFLRFPSTAASFFSSALVDDFLEAIEGGTERLSLIGWSYIVHISFRSCRPRSLALNICSLSARTSKWVDFVRSTKEAERALNNVPRASPTRDPLRNGYGNSAPPHDILLRVFCWGHFFTRGVAKGDLAIIGFDSVAREWIPSFSFYVSWINVYFLVSVEFSLVFLSVSWRSIPIKLNADHSEM